VPGDARVPLSAGRSSAKLSTTRHRQAVLTSHEGPRGTVPVAGYRWEPTRAATAPSPLTPLPQGERGTRRDVEHRKMGRSPAALLVRRHPPVRQYHTSTADYQAVAHREQARGERLEERGQKDNAMPPHQFDKLTAGSPLPPGARENYLMRRGGHRAAGRRQLASPQSLSAWPGRRRSSRSPGTRTAPSGRWRSRRR